MTNNRFENIVALLNDPNLESVTQGLMLWETLIESGADKEFYLGKLQEFDFTELKGTFSYGFGGKRVPKWLRKATFRLYVSLWILGYLAKNGDEIALSITKIELNDPVFFTLPETFIHLSGLTHFELQRSKWTKLEDVWGHFPSLVDLNLFDNEITTLPPSLELCSKLRRLDLSYNPLSALPECVRTLSDLRELKIRNFAGSTLPEWFGELTELRVLNAESANITALPESIGNLKKLHTLKLRWCHFLQSLPDSIGDCVSLRSMDIASTEISTFPSTLPVLQAWESQLNKGWRSLQHLSKLHTLEIWTEDLNREIDFAWFPSLTSLTINSGDCSLRNIGQCTHLEKIDVGREQTSVPNEICHLPKLKELALSYSSVSTLPDDIGNLSTLRKIGLSSLQLPETELMKLTPLLSAIAGTKRQYSSSKLEVDWYLDVDAYGNTKPIDKFHHRLLMREFTTIPEMNTVEQLSGFLDADTICADISTAKELLSFTIHADEPVSPLWLEKLSPSPKLKTVQFKCSFDSFPVQVIRRLLGVPSLSDTGELVFPIDIKVPKEYELDLCNVKLAVAKDYGLLATMTNFTNTVITTIPPLLAEATDLISLLCKKVPCSDFLDTVLTLPKLMTVEGEGEQYPDLWPIRTVTFQTIETFLSNASSYTNLRALIMKGAWLSEIPETVLQCSTLRYLDLSWNRLRNLDVDVSHWSSLERLVLVGNSLDSIPDKVLQLPSLKALVLPKSCEDQLPLLQQKTTLDLTTFEA